MRKISEMGKVTKVEKQPDKKPCIVIADTDCDYTAVLHSLMVSQLKNSADVCAITDREYFDRLVSQHQAADILVVSEQLFRPELPRSETVNVFVLTEKNDLVRAQEKEAGHDFAYIFRYSSPDVIFRQITGINAAQLQLSEDKTEKCQITAFCSVMPDPGKTPLALAVAECLSENAVKTLYINCAHLHTFQFFLQDKNPVLSETAYRAMSRMDDDIYEKLRKELKRQSFTYLPAFKAAAISLGIDLGIYEKLVRQAAKSLDFDHMIIDLEPVFNAENASLMALADKVVLTVDQSEASVSGLKFFMENINDADADKFVIVCSNFENGKENAFERAKAVDIPIPEYIERPEDNNSMEIHSLAGIKSIRRVAHIVS